MSEIVLEPGSYRDKDNRVFYKDHAVYRALSSQALAHWQQVRQAPFYERFSASGKLIGTQPSDIAPPPAASAEIPWAAVLEHEAIAFLSYPYEWSFGMLQDAALLQLELLEAALNDGFSLKDASPYNIQWRGARPTFIDIASLVPWKDGDPWVGYLQFCQLFLYPLFLQAYRNLPFQPWLRGNLEGITPRQCAQALSVMDGLRKGVLTHVYLHAAMQKGYARSQSDIRSDLRKAGFQKEMILANIRNLMKIVRSLRWKDSTSSWVHYAQERNYSNDDYEAKKTFVKKVVQEKRRRLVWDLGCNTGDFSRLAAGNADYVVAMDQDAGVVERLYQTLKKENLPRILPLLVDMANPSPGQGWLGKERKALVDRGTPDLTICLALVHHLALGANIPLNEWIQWIASWNCDLIIEFVGRDDSMVQSLLRNKESSHEDYNLAHFEKSLSEWFVIRHREPLSSGVRILYACEPHHRL